MLQSWSMQHRNGIGLSWAKTVLTSGYQSDNKNPDKTTAKVWNKTKEKFEIVQLQSGSIHKHKGSWRGDMVR